MRKSRRDGNLREAAAHFGGFAHFAAMSFVAASLGWTPTGPGLLADVEEHYFR